MLEVLEMIFCSVVAAVMCSLIVYAKKREKNVELPEKFEKNKIYATILFGAFVGLVAWASGHEITEEYIIIQSGAYGYVAVAIRDGVTAASRWYNNRY